MKNVDWGAFFNNFGAFLAAAAAFFTAAAALLRSWRNGKTLETNHAETIDELRKNTQITTKVAENTGTPIPIDPPPGEPPK